MHAVHALYAYYACAVCIAIANVVTPSSSIFGILVSSFLLIVTGTHFLVPRAMESGQVAGGGGGRRRRGRAGDRLRRVRAAEEAEVEMALQAVLVSWGWRGGGRWLTLDEVRQRRWVEEEARRAAWWRWVEEERTRRAIEEAIAWAAANRWLRRE